MIDGLNLYCKKKINKEDLIEVLDINESEILFISDVNGWLNKKDEKIVIEYNGVLDEDDDYPGYHYYGVSLFSNNIKDNFKKIKDKNIIVDLD